MIALVAVVMASSCMTSSAVYAAVKAKKHMDEKEKDARDARKRARQERAEAGERASKDANEAAEAERAERAERKEAEAEADRQRKEAEAEADRKRKEAERIEKESSEWATMLNNFMVAQEAQNRFKGDLTKHVNSGLAGVPGELVPRVLEKLKKRTSSKLQYCKDSKVPRFNQDLVFNQDSLIDLHERGVIPFDEKMWDNFFGGSALEITNCYENKTKGMPDFFDLDNCKRNKHLEYMRNCGGPDLFTCPCSSDPNPNPKPKNAHFYKKCNFRGTQDEIVVKPGSGDWRSSLGGEFVQGIKSIIIPDGIVVKFYVEDGKKKELIKEVKGPWSQACTDKFVKVNLIVTENLK